MDKKLLWWIFAVSSGGPTRAHIVNLLKERPASASQLARALNLSYPTVRYHLNILLENRVVVSSGATAIVMYYLSDEMEKDYPAFLDIWEKIKVSTPGRS